MIKKQIFLICVSLLFIMMIGCAPETTSSPTNSPSPTTTVQSPVYTRILDSKYIENRDKDNNVLFSWNYDASGTLKEYNVYHYDSLKRNDYIKSYSSEVTTDVNYLGKYVYTFDGTTKNIIKSEQIDKSNAIVQYFVATYNSQGKYLTYISKNSAGSIIENRDATYDVTGKYYLVETYYSDVAKKQILEKYTRNYDSTIEGRYLQEVKYQKIPVDGNDPSSDSMTYKSYESATTYKYSWSPNSLFKTYYLQQTFDSSGDFLEMIQNSFDSNGNTILKSFIASGKLQSYRTYSYDNNQIMTDESHFDKSEKIVNQFTHRLYKQGTLNFYEKVTYSYGYVTSSSKNVVDSNKLSDNRLKSPLPNHIE